MEKFFDLIGYRFNNVSLFETALTHSSYANENNCDSYERLEFLGDAILGFITAEFLYGSDRPLPEGKMTKVRAEYVCEESLYKVAQKLNFASFVRVGKGEEHTGGRGRVSILADTVEALIAAMYLDGGIEPARSFIIENILKDIDFTAPVESRDYKSRLQEELQKNGACSIEYILTGESGPDHNKEFSFAVLVNGEKLGEGSGKTKRAAEQNAAQQALSVLGSGPADKGNKA